MPEAVGNWSMERKTVRDSSMKTSQKPKEVIPTNLRGSEGKLTLNTKSIGDIRTSESKIDKTHNKMVIARPIRKRITIKSSKVDTELHPSLNSTLICKSNPSKKILNVLLGI